jgi:hypothetical protein
MSKNQNDESKESSAEKAVKDLEEKEKQEEQDQEQEEETQDQKDKESKDEDEGEDEDEDEESEDTEQALRLFKALKDPNIGPAIVQNLAANFGLNLKDATTKKDQNDIIEQIEDLVSAELGPEFKIFGGKLSAILKKIVPAVAAQQNQELALKIQQTENNRIAREVQSAMTDVFDSYNDVPNSVKKIMGRIMDEIPPIPGKTDPKRYFSHIIKMAAEEANVKLVSKNGNSQSNQNQEKTQRNKRDAAGRLASDRSSELPTGKDGKPKQFKDRRSTIAAAMATVEKDIETGKLKI